MTGRTMNFLYIIISLTWISNQYVVCQFEFSGDDDVGFEDDDELTLSSGTGPVLPTLSTSLSTSRGAGSIVGPKSEESLDGEGGSGDIWVDNSVTLPPTVINNRSRNNNDSRNPATIPPLHPDDEDDDNDDDNLYEASGDILIDPEKKGEVPKVGEEVKIDQPPIHPSTYRPTVTMPTRPPSTNRPMITTPTRPPATNRPTQTMPARPSTGYPLVQSSTSSLIDTRQQQPSSTTLDIVDIVIRPDEGLNTEPDHYDTHTQKTALALFFKIFNDPLILAGIIGGVVLALLCIVLIVVFMIHRVRKKDEGSYALGEPRRAYDIKYTRTTDQEYFA